MRAFEDVAMIHHAGDEAEPQRMFTFRSAIGLQTGAKEDGLSRIRVSKPLVEYERAQELVQIDDLFEQRVGHEIVHGHFRRIAGVTGPEVPARFDALTPAAKLQIDVRILREKGLAQVYYRDIRGGDFEELEKHR